MSLLASAPTLATEQRFYTLLGIMAMILAGIIFLVVRLFKAGRTYQESLDKLDDAAGAITELGADLKELIRQKEREHDSMRQEMNLTESRLDRHEQWHLDSAAAAEKRKKRGR